MRDLFQIMELYDGKITLDASTLTQSEIAILAEMKIELNEKLLSQTTKSEEKSGVNRSSKEFDVNDKEYKSQLFAHMKRKIN